MSQIVALIVTLLEVFPPPVTSLILLVICLSCVMMLLELIKLILDAIPFI